VLFEPYNEPLDVDWSGVIKPYHEEVLQVIRPHSNNIVILGTRTWSQEVDVASQDKVADSNVAYTVHFYASTHKQELRNRVSTALSNGVAVFATEWGNCEASGDGALDFGSTSTWLGFFQQHHISDANWAVADKEEACAALRPGASCSGNWGASELTESGTWMRNSLRAFSGLSSELGGSGSGSSSGSCAADDEDCSAARCCATAGKTCFRKDDFWASCRLDCTPGAVNPDDPEEFRSPWSCQVLSTHVDQLLCDAHFRSQQQTTETNMTVLSSADNQPSPIFACMAFAVVVLMATSPPR